MASNPIPEELQDLIQRGEFIGETPPGNKICAKTFTYVNGSSWSGAAYRAWWRENHDYNEMYIKKTVTEMIKSIDDYSNTEFLPLIFKTMAKMKTGLQNMKEVYNTPNPKFAGKLNGHITNIELQLNRNRDVIQELFKLVNQQRPINQADLKATVDMKAAVDLYARRTKND